MEKSKLNKPVAFNKKNLKDCIILQHVKRRNFSGYVKKLIWEDIPEKNKKLLHEDMGVQVHSTIKQEKKIAKKEKKLSAAERIEHLKQQTKKQQPSQGPLPVFLPNKNINN
ncbi:hypothetical protein V7024_19690 [Bacillus sp. JJ864]|uniref:hypothetical protein n=1 Tax=Bacillus sp. JJ864 TaxID=3122975 RepID=UPI002FFED2A1